MREIRLDENYSGQTRTNNRCRTKRAAYKKTAREALDQQYPIQALTWLIVNRLFFSCWHWQIPSPLPWILVASAGGNARCRRS